MIGSEPAAVGLRDLVAGARAGRAIARGEILGVASGYRAVAEAEDEAKADYVGKDREPKIAGAQQIEVRDRPDQTEDDRRDQQDEDAAIDRVRETCRPISMNTNIDAAAMRPIVSASFPGKPTAFI